MLLKHSLKHAAGWASVVASFFTRRIHPGVCVLMYHRVACTGVFDLSLDDWNVTPSRLHQQLHWLSQNARCVPLQEVFQPGILMSSAKPVVALTFDDGFANFYHHVLPLLVRFSIPATIFVVSRYVGSDEPYPFDRWAQKNCSRCSTVAWRPITWAELEECLSSGLVSVGSHSHQHLNGLNSSDGQLTDEAAVSGELLRRRLGPKHAAMYAYPYGSTRLGQVRPAYLGAVRQAGYQFAVTTDLGLVQADTPPLQIPRVEVHAYDSPRILRAKVLGHLRPQHFCDRLRQAQRG